MTPSDWPRQLRQAYRRQPAAMRTRWWVAGGGTALLLVYALANASGAAGEPSVTALAVSVMLKLAFILVIIYASLALLKHFQGVRGLARERQVSVLESVRLSPRQALHLVRVGEQTLLIGATDAGLSLLADLEPAATAAKMPATTAFASLLPLPDQAAAGSVS
jgi:flagellar biosynthetic protein FliO